MMHSRIFCVQLAGRGEAAMSFHLRTRGCWSEATNAPIFFVCEPTVSPVTIETEVLPAVTVEKEAFERLGEIVSRNGRTILSSIAVRLPVRLKKLAGTALSKELASATDLEFALYTGSSPHSNSRWPHSGWLKGTVSIYRCCLKPQPCRPM